MFKNTHLEAVIVRTSVKGGTLIGHKNPTVWKLLKSMQNEMGADDHAKLSLGETGQSTNDLMKDVP